MKITDPKRFATFLLGLFVIIGGAMLLLLSNPKMKDSGELLIEEGDGAQIIWNRFEAEGFTSWVWPWQYQSWRLRAEQNLKAGQYGISEGETVRAVISRLVAGDAAQGELTITYPEGFTLAQVVARTAARGISSEEDMRKVAVPALHVDKYSYLKAIPAGRNLEGYLFPDTYRVFPDDEAEDVIKRMLDNFDVKFTLELREEAKAAGRTLDEIVIIASIIEREVLSDNDMALVSGILWARSDDGVGLDADATVRYALDKWVDPLTQEDLEIDSPYNTRKFKGLPPGPISNPGLRALLAAVRPEKSDYYYYLSASDGSTVFSRTNDEHNANKVKFLQ